MDERDATAMLAMRRDELEALFRSSAAGPIPVGRGRGTALVATGTPLAGVAARAAGLFWRGKLFGDGRLRNLLTPIGVRAIPAKVAIGAGELDGNPSVVLDYASTSRVAGFVRDEIRQVGDDRYLGIVYVKGRRAPLSFFLDFSPWASPPRWYRDVAMVEHDAGWIDRAPIRIEHHVHVVAEPSAVFAALADHESWPRWFRGMQRVRVDGTASGVGALRTVWVGGTHVQERFGAWEDNRRLTFSLVRSSVPGLSAMVEDWSVSPADDGTLVSIRIGAETVPVLHPATGLARSVIARSTRGALGISGAFSQGRATS